MQNNTECCGKSSIQKSSERRPASKDESILYIFMSFSVPKQVWLDLWKQVDLIPFQFVLRGLPDNSFQKLAEKVKEYGCSVTIHPDLFDKFGVTTVPTFIWINRGVVKGVSGNVSLEYAMKHLRGQDS